MAAKKTPAKKTPAKKTPAKKTPAKKTPAKKKATGNRAPGVSATTLRYVTATARVNLGEGLHAGVTVRDVGGVLQFAYEGVDYASLRFDGDDLEVRFRKPSVLDDWERRKGLFREDRVRLGWLVWRTPIKRDPRPWLEAGIGGTVGRTVFELKQR